MPRIRRQRDPQARRNALAMRNATPIAQELRGQRIDRRLTQAQLAKVVGMSVATVGRAERGIMTAKTVSLLRQGLQSITPSAS